ncbi:MAG: hypothetical protein EB158_04680 [Nitrosopumilaceae archaeon]|nr:hypothetical protein [Nitrosopumilaceae archaeon]
MKAVPISNPPTNLISQSVSSTQINLSWTAPVNATQNAVNGYKIEQDSGCDGSFAVIVTNNTSTSYLNTGLNFGTCYAYRVSALNSAGASAPSNVDFDVTFMVPAIPTGLSAKTTTTSAKISWNAPANNGYIITGYQIQRNGTILVQNTANTRLSYVDLGLKPLSTQTYRVAAWNIAGLGPFSANITAKTSNQTGIDNLGQAVSDFVQKRNELLKKQREEYMRIIQQCHDKTTNATGTVRKLTAEDCRRLIHELNDKYKEARKQFREEFKFFKEDTKDLFKEVKKSGLIGKDDIKSIKREFKDYENETEKESKSLKKDIKEFRKDLKKEKHGKHGHHDDDD